MVRPPFAMLETHWLKNVASMTGSARPPSNILVTWMDVSRDDSHAMMLHLDTHSCSNRNMSLSLHSLATPVFIAVKTRVFWRFFLSPNAGLGWRFFMHYYCSKEICFNYASLFAATWSSITLLQYVKHENMKTWNHDSMNYRMKMKKNLKNRMRKMKEKVLYIVYVYVFVYVYVILNPLPNHGWCRYSV